MKHNQLNEMNRYRNGSGFLYGRCDFSLNCPNTNSTKVVDLQGKTVIPGLIEGHMHYPAEGQKLLELDVFWK
ncbi:MAG: hypothetical protein ACOX8T_10350, partial [Bacillota bacterium]